PHPAKLERHVSGADRDESVRRASGRPRLKRSVIATGTPPAPHLRYFSTEHKGGRDGPIRAEVLLARTCDRSARTGGSDPRRRRPSGRCLPTIGCQSCGLRAIAGEVSTTPAVVDGEGMSAEHSVRAAAEF